MKLTDTKKGSAISNRTFFCGESRIRTYEDISQRSYSPPQLATLVSPQNIFQVFFGNKKAILIRMA